ncbi:hypothetical protein [Caproiciproducens sp. MSJ-32]|uniref:hypothetical protein n=1 Tax=Caproiciproducens sp. MSJ-32 TaxID=2841527 RepID=UPI001C1028C4|nr:hypothetical protein [Caproiciproducens sp. MSJ-32]MBU5455974.1 hypothetical protein [Caproiciproducens sp. MSJ-32]
MSKKLFTEKEIEIFEECGFNIDILGMKRVELSGKRWRSAFRRNGITINAKIKINKITNIKLNRIANEIV